MMNQDVLQRTDIEGLNDIRGRRWMFIGHVMRKGHDNDCGVALTWTPEGKKKRGRPKTRRRRTVEAEKKRAGWESWNEVRAAANDRDSLRRCVEALCAT